MSIRIWLVILLTTHELTTHEHSWTNEFHNLNTNIKVSNLDNLSLLHTNICSLQSSFDKLEVILHKLIIELDIVAITETWLDRDNVTFTPGLFRAYQKYKGMPDSSKKMGVVFHVKGSIQYIW